MLAILQHNNTNITLRNTTASYTTALLLSAADNTISILQAQPPRGEYSVAEGDESWRIAAHITTPDEAVKHLPPHHHPHLRRYRMGAHNGDSDSL